jgi:hypothetical protein
MTCTKHPQAEHRQYQRHDGKPGGYTKCMECARTAARDRIRATRAKQYVDCAPLTGPRGPTEGKRGPRRRKMLLVEFESETALNELTKWVTDNPLPSWY